MPVPNFLSNFLANLPFGPIAMGAGLLHFTIGGVAALVAKRKGRNLGVWLPLGLIAGTPALIAAWRLTPIVTEPSDE
jgi:hypothetical protein